MDIVSFAEMLNGREYRQEITKEEIKLAKDLGFVVVFGYSDDLTELEGAISGEVSSYNGTTIYLTKEGIFEECECECKYSIKAKENSKVIEVFWGRGFTWEYETNIPHEIFEIIEEDEKYCRGIVFDIKNLD